MHTVHNLFPNRQRRIRRVSRRRREGMELNQLRYFLSVARHAGFSQATYELGVSQPALSRSVAKLEEELGQPLFERDSRPLTLTEVGKSFQQRCIQILGMVDQAVAEITDDENRGQVRIGAIPTIAPFWLPQLFSRFTKNRPNVRVLVVEEVTTRLLERIRHGELDIAIMALPIDHHYLEFIKLFDEELFLIHGKRHELSKKKKIRMNDVVAFPMLLLDQSHCLSEQMESFCKQKNSQPIVLERVAQLSTVQAMVAIGHGISFVPAMARTGNSDIRVQYRSLDGVKPKRAVIMVWNPYRFQSRLVQRFRQEVMEAANDIVTQFD